jgi:hypothetical protein
MQTNNAISLEVRLAQIAVIPGSDFRRADSTDCGHQAVRKGPPRYAPNTGRCYRSANLVSRQNPPQALRPASSLPVLAVATGSRTAFDASR